MTVKESGGRAVTLRSMTARERDLFEEGALNRGRAKAQLRGSNGGGDRPGFRRPGRRARGAGREEIAAELDLDNFRAILVAETIWENGGRAFANEEGRRVLGGQPAAVIMRLFEVAQRLNGMSAEDVEELEKKLRGDARRRFLFRLALALGRTVAELTATLSERELTEWMVIARIEGGLGEERADLRMGILASVMANANRDPARRPEPYGPADFMPRFGAAEEDDGLDRAGLRRDDAERPTTLRRDAAPPPPRPAPAADGEGEAVALDDIDRELVMLDVEETLDAMMRRIGGDHAG